jgi:hypothetical protein
MLMTSRHPRRVEAQATKERQVVTVLKRDDVQESGLADGLGVVGLAGRRVGHPGEVPRQSAGDLDVQTGGAVLAGPQLGVV